MIVFYIEHWMHWAEPKKNWNAGYVKILGSPAICIGFFEFVQILLISVSPMESFSLHFLSQWHQDTTWESVIIAGTGRHRKETWSLPTLLYKCAFVAAFIPIRERYSITSRPRDIHLPGQEVRVSFPRGDTDSTTFLTVSSYLMKVLQC